MSCLNCTSRVLRAFLQDSLLPSRSLKLRLSASLSTPIFHRPFPSASALRYKLAAFHIQQRRNDSSFSYAVAENLSDDDYVPFVDMTAARRSKILPVSEHERLVGYNHRPPPPSTPQEEVIGSCEPEIELMSPIPAAEEFDFETCASSVEATETAEEPHVPAETRSHEDDLHFIRTLGLPVAGETIPQENIPLKRDPAVPEPPQREYSYRDDIQQAIESDYATPTTVKHPKTWKLPAIEGLDVAPTDNCFTQKDLKFLNYVENTPKSELEPWKLEKAANLRKFRGAEWRPQKRLSAEAMEGIKVLHKNHPEYTTPKLAELFKVSPQVISRILRSKWQPNSEQAKARSERWERRGDSIWEKWIREGVVKTKKIKKMERRERREKEERWEKREKREKEKWEKLERKRHDADADAVMSVSDRFL